jgi:hypothetical protein
MRIGYQSIYYLQRLKSKINENETKKTSDKSLPVVDNNLSSKEIFVYLFKLG